MSLDTLSRWTIYLTIGGSILFTLAIGGYYLTAYVIFLIKELL